MKKFLGRNIAVRRLCENLQSGDVRHGLSDGNWSLIDLLDGLADACGPDANLDLAIWTASGEHGRNLHRLLESGKIANLSLMVDRSFVSRKPDVCKKVVDLFGADNLRVWQSHAKFAIFHGGKVECLAMFSANLNRNTRVENFTVWADAGMVKEYRKIVAELWASQPANVGIERQTTAMTEWTRPLLGPAEPSQEKGPAVDLPDMPSITDMPEI